MKPFLSDKIVSKEQILLVENDEIISEDTKIAEQPKSFFSKTVKNLKISEYKPQNDSLFENVSDLILKVILKCKNHLSILTIGEVCKNKSNSLYFHVHKLQEMKYKNKFWVYTQLKYVKILIYQQRYLRKM